MEREQFGLKEAMDQFSDPSIDLLTDPEQKLTVLLESFQSVDTRMIILDLVFDLIRSHPDIQAATSVGKRLQLC